MYVYSMSSSVGTWLEILAHQFAAVTHFSVFVCTCFLQIKLRKTGFGKYVGIFRTLSVELENEKSYTSAGTCMQKEYFSYAGILMRKQTYFQLG